MSDEIKQDQGSEPTEKELQDQLKAFRESQQAYLEQAFRWLIDFVASYFPEDHLAMEDAVTDVHFIQAVVEGGKPVGALVYRFRKALDKKEYFLEMGKDYQEALGVTDVLFLDSETGDFNPPDNLETDGNLLEIPREKVTGKIRELREELKRRARLRALKESLS